MFGMWRTVVLRNNCGRDDVEVFRRQRVQQLSWKVDWGWVMHDLDNSCGGGAYICHQSVWVCVFVVCVAHKRVNIYIFMFHSRSVVIGGGRRLSYQHWRLLHVYVPPRMSMCYHRVGFTDWQKKNVAQFNQQTTIVRDKSLLLAHNITHACTFRISKGFPVECVDSVYNVRAEFNKL